MLNRYLLPEWPAPAQINAFTTLRALGDVQGVSCGAFSRFNLADHCGDKAEHVQANRALMQKDWGWKKKPVWLDQVHGTSVIAAHHYSSKQRPVADASWTDQPDTPCIVMTADCLPVIICNKQGSKVAAVHAGWRSLSAGIIEKTLEVLGEPPESLFVWLSPAISQAFFEVGPEVRDTFLQAQLSAETAFIPGKGDRWLADIYQLARFRLRRLGVTVIDGGNHCTYREADAFYSYRREGQTGRMATAIWFSV